MKRLRHEMTSLAGDHTASTRQKRESHTVLEHRHPHSSQLLCSVANFFPSAFYVPGLFHSFLVASHLILSTTPKESLLSSHFTEEKSKVQKDYVNCSGSPSRWKTQDSASETRGSQAPALLFVSAMTRSFDHPHFTEKKLKA